MFRVRVPKAVPPDDDPPIAPALYGLPPQEGARHLGRGSVAPASFAGPGPPSLRRSSDLFVGAVTLTCLVATILGVLVLPGLLGNVGERAVVWSERATAMTGYLAFAGLILLTSSGGYELIQRAELGAARYPLLGLSVVVVGLAAPSISTRLIAIPQALLGIMASALAIVAASRAVRAPHTRAPGAVLGLIGFAGLFRVLAWSLASMSADSPTGFSISRGLGTTAIVFSGLAQLVAVAYFATRGKIQGRFLGNFALVLGFFATYLASRKPAFAGALGHVLAGAIAHGAASPEPFAFAPIAQVLFPTGIFLALVAFVQRRQVTAVACALALGLASQGRLDIPLPAMFVVVAGLLLASAAQDDRAMWTDLIATRAQKLVDGREDKGDPPPPRPASVAPLAKVPTPPKPRAAARPPAADDPSTAGPPAEAAASSAPDAKTTSLVTAVPAEDPET